MVFIMCVLVIVIYIEIKDQIGSLTEDTRKIRSDENAFDIEECYINTCRPALALVPTGLSRHQSGVGTSTNGPLTPPIRRWY